MLLVTDCSVWAAPAVHPLKYSSTTRRSFRATSRLLTRPYSPRRIRLTASVRRTVSRPSASAVEMGHSAVWATGVNVVFGLPPSEGAVGDELPQASVEHSTATLARPLVAGRPIVAIFSAP
jgi:hypothetical protein